jgi:RNA polymerase sigma-B factor
MADPAPYRVTEAFELAVRPETAARARQTLAQIMRLDSVRLAEAQLLVTELINNAIQHGVTDRLALSVGHDAAAWRVEVSHPALADIDPADHGLGFTLLTRIARRWGHSWSNGRLTVWYEMRTAGTGAAVEDLDDQEVLLRAADDPFWRDEAVRRFTNLAMAGARRFRGRGVADADLQQVAMLGLVNAVVRFEPDKGAFEAFATATINGELKRHLRDRAWSVRVPRSLQELTLKTGRAAEQLSQTLGRQPTASDLAAHLDVTEEEVLEAIAANSAYHWDSLLDPHPETGLTLAEALPGDADVARSAANLLEVSKGLELLPARERDIVYLRFFEDLTQSEIAERIGLSQMHVSRLLARALARLRSVLE